MANYSGIDIPSPQEIMAQLQQQRYQVMTQGNSQQKRSANIETALDTIFGNPQLQLSKKVTSAVDSAQKNFTPHPGATDLDNELSRLQGMRDAVASIDPGTANKINAQMLQLGQMKLEQDKIRTATAADKQEIDFKKDMHPDEVALAGEKLSAAQNDLVTLAKGSDIRSVRKNNTAELSNLLAKGYRETSISIQAPSASEVVNGRSEPTKPVQTDIQTAMINANQQLDALAQTAKNFDPKFLTMPQQLFQGAQNIYEKMGGKLSPADVAAKTKYEDFRSSAYNVLNNYIKAITGAAMSEKEADRIRQRIADAENDGPTKFLGKMRSTVREILQNQKRAQDMLTHGVPVGSMPYGNAWDNIATVNVSESEVNAFMGRFGVSSEQPASSGDWKDMGNGVRMRQTN